MKAHAPLISIVAILSLSACNSPLPKPPVVAPPPPPTEPAPTNDSPPATVQAAVEAVKKQLLAVRYTLGDEVQIKTPAATHPVWCGELDQSGEFWVNRMVFSNMTVTLSLQTMSKSDDKANLGVDLTVWNLGASEANSNSNAQTVTYLFKPEFTEEYPDQLRDDLAPAKLAIAHRLAGDQSPDVAPLPAGYELANAVDKAVFGLLDTDHSQAPCLTPKKLGVALAIQVESDTSATGGATIQVIKASDAATWTNQQNNTIRIEFDDEGGNTAQVAAKPGAAKHHKGKAANTPTNSGQNTPPAPKPKSQ
jgi:hypothetical protein